MRSARVNQLAGVILAVQLTSMMMPLTTKGSTPIEGNPLEAPRVLVDDHRDCRLVFAACLMVVHPSPRQPVWRGREDDLLVDPVHLVR